MIIGITGGKGGTGKSSIATSLAFNIAKDHKVLLCDADADCPNDHLILGIELERQETISQRIPKIDEKICTRCGRCGKACYRNAILGVESKLPFFMPDQCNGCGACYHVCKDKAIAWEEKTIGWISKGSRHNIDFLSAELKVGEPGSERIIKRMSEIAFNKKDEYEFIIIDTAAGTHCDVISALEPCDKVLAVTEPTPLGRHDLNLIIKVIKNLDKEYEIVLNRYEFGYEKIHQSLLEKEGKRFFATIPYSKEIMEQYSNSLPIVHESIEKLSEKVKML